MNFLFSHLNAVVLGVWLILALVVYVWLWWQPFRKKISYRTLVIAAFGVHLASGTIATVGQYFAWNKGNAIAQALVSAPLPHEVPLSWFLEWSRLLFERTHGYFAFYAFEHFFLKTVALFFIAGLFYLFLITRARYRPINFREGDIMLIVLAMLIAGWPGVIVLLPVALVCAVVLSIGAKIFYGIERTSLSYAFIVAAPIALIFAPQILSALSLYLLLKL